MQMMTFCAVLLLFLQQCLGQFVVNINNVQQPGGSIESASGPQLMINSTTGSIEADTAFGTSQALYEANAGAYATRIAATNSSIVTNDFYDPANVTTTEPGTVPVVALPPQTKIESANDDQYNYQNILSLSILFYEAQRSGSSQGNRVTWRADAQMQEVTSSNTTLVGGYADAGDNLKLNFPAAFAASMLAWGLSEFPQGFANSGETDNALTALQWFCDFFIKCHHADLAFTAQCGDPDVDHSTWIPIEQSVTPRPCYDLTPAAPGADMLGAVSAALASASQVFSLNDTAYSNILLANARDLYAFAKAYPTVKYSDSIKQAYVYPSSSTYDDLAWAACWLFIRTGEQQFLDDAHTFFDELSGVGTMFSWDDYSAGVAILLSTIDNDQSYVQKVQQFITSWITGTDGVQYTPKGAAWASQWGSQRYTANAAIIASVFAHRAPDNMFSVQFACWVRKQIRLMLGDAGMSYVVGYGTNPPLQAHHRSASCPGPNLTCGYSFFNTPDPNPNVIQGALIGGPNLDGSLSDVRSNYINMEVALDYNAAFTSVLAFLAADAIPNAGNSVQCQSM